MRGIEEKHLQNKKKKNDKHNDSYLDVWAASEQLLLLTFTLEYKVLACLIQNLCKFYPSGGFRNSEVHIIFWHIIMSIEGLYKDSKTNVCERA